MSGQVCQVTVCSWRHRSRGHCVEVWTFNFFVINNNKTKILHLQYTKQTRSKACWVQRIYTETYILTTNWTVSDTFTMPDETVDIWGQRSWPDMIITWLKLWNVVLTELRLLVTVDQWLHITLRVIIHSLCIFRMKETQPKKEDEVKSSKHSSSKEHKRYD